MERITLEAFVLDADYPATRTALLAQAVERGVEPAALRRLEELDEDEYRSADQVGARLHRAEPDGGDDPRIRLETVRSALAELQEELSALPEDDFPARAALRSLQQALRAEAADLEARLGAKNRSA